MSFPVVMYSVEAARMGGLSGNYVPLSMIRQGEEVWCNGCQSILPASQIKQHLEKRHKRGRGAWCGICHMSCGEGKVPRQQHEAAAQHKKIAQRQQMDFCPQHFCLAGLGHETCQSLSPLQIKEKFPCGKSAKYSSSQKECADVIPQEESEKFREEKVDEKLALKSDVVVKEVVDRNDQKVVKKKENVYDQVIENRMIALAMAAGRCVTRKRGVAMAYGPFCEQHMRETTGHVAGTVLSRVNLQKENTDCRLCKNYHNFVDKDAEICPDTATIRVNVDSTRFLKCRSTSSRTPGVISVRDAECYRSVVDFSLYDFDSVEMNFKLRVDQAKEKTSAEKAFDEVEPVPVQYPKILETGETTEEEGEDPVVQGLRVEIAQKLEQEKERYNFAPAVNSTPVEEEMPTTDEKTVDENGKPHRCQHCNRVKIPGHYCYAGYLKTKQA